MPAVDADVDNIKHQILRGGTIGIAIAISITGIRLILRIRTLWWDDAFAFAGLISLIITAVTAKLYYSINGESTIPHHSRVALYYIFAVTFDLTIWTSRLSILFSIIHLNRYKRQLFFAALLFITAMFILIAQVFWVCEPQDKKTKWKSDVIPQCVLGKGVAITQVTTDALADAVLVFFPLIILRSLKSSETMALRVRLSASFAIGGLTTVVSIVHAFYLWKGTLISIVVSNAELAVSLIICNFVVLAAAIHRLWDKYHPPKAIVKSNIYSTIHFEPTPQGGNAESQYDSRGVIPEHSIEGALATRSVGSHD